MALFKILKGNEANLPSTKHEGWAYVTEKGNMYVDLSNDKRVKIGNRADSAEYADKATGDTQTIRSKYLAKIKQVTSDGTQFTFRGETGDGTNANNLISIPLAGDKAGLVSNAAQTIKGEKTFANGIKFPDVTSTTYPAVSTGLTWNGSTDSAKIYYEVQASDKGMLIIEARDDTNAGAIFRNSNSKEEVSIVNGLVTGKFKGNLSGTATHATNDAKGKNIASYIASVLAQSDNRTIRVTTGDGTTNDVKLYFAASSSFGGAADSANILNVNNTESIGASRMQFFQKSGDATLMPSADWWSLVRLQHGGYASTGYWTEMAYAFHSDTIKFRRNQNGTKSAWKTIAFTDGTIAKANQAQKDWSGQIITQTYMKYPLSISDEIITMTRGDGTTSTITVPDKKVSQVETTTTNYRPIILGATNSTDVSKLSATIRGQVYASTKFYAQPSTGTLVATTFKGALDGNAKTATNATYAEKAKGDTTTIRSTYVSSVAKNGVKVVVKKGDGTSNEFQLDFLPLAGGTMVGDIAFSKDNVIQWSRNTDFARIGFKNDSDADADSYMYFHTGDNGNEYFKFRITSGSTVTDVLNIKNGAATFNGTVTATKFIGALQGTADYADKAKGDTVSIRSKYVSSVLKKSGSNYVLRVTKGDGTVNDVDLYFAASSSCGGDANQAIKTKDLGTHTEAASGTTANAPTTGMLYGSGMYMTRTYNDSNTPCDYGNIINVAGSGTGQLLLGWSGSDNTTGDIYYRSHRDTSTGGWSPWKRVAFTDGKIKSAEFADKATGDTTTIRSTYVKSVVKNGVKVVVKKGDGTSNEFQLDFLPLAGGTMTGNVTFNNETQSIYKIARKKNGVGGWAYTPICFTGSDNAIFAYIGALGGGNILNYLYIGAGDWDAATNLRIYPSGNVSAKKFIGTLEGTADYATKATGDTNSIRSTYVKSVVKKSGSNYVFTVSKGDGTANDVNLYFAASASCGGAALSANILNAHSDSNITTRGGDAKLRYSYGITKTATGLFAASDNANAILTINKHSGNYDSQLGFSSNGNIYYRSFDGSALNTTTGWKTIAFTDGKIKSAEFADKATGDSTTIRSTYIASIKQVTSNGTTFTFRGYAGNGTERADLISIPSASVDKAGLVTTAAQTWAGNKTFNGDIYISHNTVQSMAYNTTNPKLVFSENGGQPVGLVYTDYDTYRSPAGLKVMSTVSDNEKAWFEVEGDLYVGRNLYDKEHNILLASKYIAQLIGSQGSTNYTITPRNQEGTNLTNILNVPMNLVGSADTNSKIFLVGTTSQNSKAQTGYSHDTVFIDSDGFLYDSGNKPSYHSRVGIGNTNNYKYHRIAKIDTTSSWYDGTILLYISQDYHGGKYGILRLSLRTNEISKGPNASVEAEWIARSGFALTDFKICLYSATGKAYADLYYISDSTYAGITVKQIQQGSRGSLTQGRWILTNSSENHDTTTSDKKGSSSYKDIAAAQAGLRGGVAYTSTYDTIDDSRVNESNWADRALADWNGNKFREKYIATLAVKTSSKTVFAFKGVNMQGSEISAITVPNASASVAGIITAEAQTLAGNKTLNNDLYVKGKVAVSTTSTSGYNLYVNGTSYFVGNMNLKADLVLESQGANRLVWTDSNRKLMAASHYASATQIGICTTDITTIGSYNLFVKGITKFDGNTTHNGIVYFANGTKYYVNSEADARLRYVGVGTAAPSKDYALNAGGAVYISGVTTHVGNVNPGANNTYSLGLSGTRWSKLYVGSADSYGSATQPIYWSAGVPKATTYSLKATVNNGSAYRLAYYSGANAISQTGHYASTTQIGINITNTTTIGSNALYVNGTAYFSDAVKISGGHSLTCGTIYSDNVHCNDIDNSGYLNVSGSSTFRMPATFYDGVTMKDTLKISGSLTCDTKVTINGSLNVNNNALLRKVYINGVNTKTGFINWGTPSSAYNSGFAMGGLKGLCISQNGEETSGMQFNGDYIAMWSPCDEYSLRYFDEDDGSEVWNIDDSGFFSGTAKSSKDTGYASYTTTNGTANYVLVTIYSAQTHWMSAFTLRVYQGYQHYDITFSGYQYGTNYWHQPQATLTSSTVTSLTVYFGYNSTTSMWVAIPGNAYTGAKVINVVNGYNKFTDIANAFYISKPSSLPGTLQKSMTIYRQWIRGESVTGAVWNDYAECRKADSQEPGYVMFEKGDDTLSKTIERLQHFAGIVSDTWGFSQGETVDAKTNIAVAGRVLAHPYRDRSEYKPGDCVCAAPGGKVDIMTREEIVQYPDRIVGTVSCVPEYEEWGGGEGADRDPVKVNGRIWIKVR